MKAHIFFKIIYLFLIIVMGCSPDNDDNPLGSIVQTQWKGTLSNQDTVYEIIVVFSYETSGYYIIEDDSFGFSYHRNNKIIQISGYNGDLLNGEWMIDKLTEGQFILTRQPFIEVQKRVLNLNKINQL